MTLRERQSLFASLVPRLIDWAFSHGYEITLGEAWRDPETAARNALRGTGTRDSLHCDRLAIDLNLFKDGKWLSDSVSHKPLGEYWKSLHRDCRWGGDFKRPDGNHYSLTDGRRA